MMSKTPRAKAADHYKASHSGQVISRHWKGADACHVAAESSETWHPAPCLSLTGFENYFGQTAPVPLPLPPFWTGTCWLYAGSMGAGTSSLVRQVPRAAGVGPRGQYSGTASTHLTWMM